MNDERESIENENEGIESKKRNKNSNQSTNTILDIVMFLVMLAIFCVEGELHESLAYMIGGLTIVHIALHWRQFTAMLKKGNTNAILDIIMFLVMLAIFCVEGELHESLAYMIGGLTIVHIALHWRQFKVMYCRLIPEVRYQRLAAFFTAILVIAILTMPLYINVGDSGHMGGHGRDGDFGPTGRYHSEGRHH